MNLEQIITALEETQEQLCENHLEVLIKKYVQNEPMSNIELKIIYNYMGKRIHEWDKTPNSKENIIY